MNKHKTKQAKPQQKTLAEAPQNHVYSTPDFQIDVTVNGEDVWLSQKDMALLFGVHPMTINEHIKNVVAADGTQESTIRKILIVAADGKRREVLHYGLDIIIPVGYRVGSPQATEFRKWANGILKQYLLVGYVINETKTGNKSLLKMEKDLALFEKHGLSNRPEVQRLSRVYENKLGAELLFAIIKDVCTNPDYGRIKGLEYKTLFGFFADELKRMLGTDKIRESLPDRQLMAFTLAEATFRGMVSNQKSMTNEQVIEALRMAFEPIGKYLRGTSELMGVHPVTDKPLLPSGKGR